MAGNLIPNAVWEDIERLLPARPVSPKGGRPAIGDREVLTGIVFVLKTGIPWEELPLELGCGCGMTCLRRLRAWQQGGVWGQVQPILEQRLRSNKPLDWARLGSDGIASRDVDEDSNVTISGDHGVRENARMFSEPHPLPAMMAFHRAVDTSAAEHAPTEHSHSTSRDF